MMKQVICIRWGNKYGPDFVNKLYAMVARNITPPFTFTCFTDSAEGVRPEVDCQPLPEIPYELPVTRRGMWPKSRLWGEKLGNLSGPVLFLDLDVVVTGSLDDLFAYGDPAQVILSRNAAKPFERIGQTSVFRFPVGKLAPMQEAFARNAQQIAEEYVYEQRFVTRNAPGGIDLFPKTWIRHYRYECVPFFPLNLFMPPRLPHDARIVIFPGGVYPDSAIRGGWQDREGWSLEQHLKGFFSLDHTQEGGHRRYLTHFMQPATWLADHWRE